MARLYELADIVLHNGSVLRNDATPSTDDFMTIQTPPQQWSYALTIAPRQAEEIKGKYISTSVRVRVAEGEIGIGILTKDETKFLHEILVAESSEWSELQLVINPQDQCGPLVVRNVSPMNTRSVVDLAIGESILSIGDPELLELRPIDIFFDRNVFANFRPWAGRVPSGYFTDWTGILTRADVWAFPTEQVAVFNRERYEAKELPFGDEHVLDWVPLIQAILRSHGTFSMAALGAGWGRWVSAGAALARQLQLSFKGIAVEAEPQHFAWMQRHMSENNIEGVTPINAAASGSSGECLFRIGAEPSAWYGQSIAAHVGSTDLSQIGKENYIRVKTITIEELLAGVPRLDYLHMDIQGTEYEFLSKSPDLIDERVAMVNVGTHSRLIEARLRSMFGRLGWTSLYDIPMGCKGLVHFGEQVFPIVEFGDGVQVWTNPKLLT